MAKITMMGRYSVGKRTIASAFTGKDRESLNSKQSRWISQMKGSKGDVHIQGLPEEHGRMSAYRQRMQAIGESDAFIVVLRNSEPVHFEYYREMVVNTLADKGTPMGPWLVIAGYITDKVPELNPIIEQFAKSINATVELVNVSKLSKKIESEVKKIDSIIQSFHASIATAPKEVPKKKEKEEEEYVEWDDMPYTALPVPVLTPSVLPTPVPTPAPKPIAAPKKFVRSAPAPVLSRAPAPVIAAQTPVPNTKKEEKVTSAKMEPKPSAVSRALSYLVRGGSVA